MSIISNSEHETLIQGVTLGRTLERGSVVALYGDLGAGKTVFTRGIAEGLGIDAGITSPTFTVVNEYYGDIPLFHFDMYRLENQTELFDIGWDDYLERGGVCIVEWSEKVPDAFPPETITVRISKAREGIRSDDVRYIEIVRGGEDAC